MFPLYLIAPTEPIIIVYHSWSYRKTENFVKELARKIPKIPLTKMRPKFQSEGYLGAGGHEDTIPPKPTFLWESGRGG